MTTQTPALTVDDIFDGRKGHRAEAQTTFAQIGFWVRAELGLNTPVYDNEDGYLKFKMSGRRNHWLWVRLNPADLYDIRITKYSSKLLSHLLVAGADDLYAEDLGFGIRALANEVA